MVGHVLYILDVISITGLELPEKVALCKERIQRLNPTIFPDNAYPADIKTFRRNGFKMVDFKKDILAGVEAVRVRFMPGTGRAPTMYMIKGDNGCELLASKVIQLHWKIDKNTGQLTDEIDAKDDDECDALRYLCQNVHPNKTKMAAEFGNKDQEPLYKVNPNKDWMKNKIRELTDGNDEQVEVTGKPGGLLFTI